MKDLLQRAKKQYDENKLEEYTQTTVRWLQILTDPAVLGIISESFSNLKEEMLFELLQLKIFDSNKDGKLCLSEMARLVGLQLHKYLSLAFNVDVKIGNVASLIFKQAVTRPGELSTKISGLGPLKILFSHFKHNVPI